MRSAPNGVAGMKHGSPSASRPAFSGWNPSTSFAGGIASSTASPWAGAASGSWTRMPCTAGSAPSWRTRRTTSSVLVPAGNCTRSTVMPASMQASCFFFMYTCDAGSSPTETSASLGLTPASSRTRVRICASMRTADAGSSPVSRRAPSSPAAGPFAYGICRRWIRVALPVVSSTLTTAAFIRRSPEAGCSRSGIRVRNRRSAAARSMPITLSNPPVIPASHRNAVPLGRMRSSAVCTCVCVPTMAETRPSRCQPRATFSAVVSAWKSTKMTLACLPSVSSTASAVRNGQSASFMNTRPSRFTTPTCVPLAALNTRKPRPGVPSGSFAGRTSRGSSARYSIESFLSHRWLPPVSTSQPASNSSRATSRVTPKPAAEFSQLQMIKCRSWRRFRSGNSARSTSRPGEPITSATNNRFVTTASLLRVVHGPRLADHRDPDLARILELLLDAPGNLARQSLRARVVDPMVLHHDADLAAGLDGVALLHALERVSDPLERLEPLDVRLETLAPRAGARAADRVGGAHEHRPQAAAGVVVVMIADRLEHLLRFAVAGRHLHAERGVRALLVVIDGLADVVEQAAALGHHLVHADLGRHHAAQVRDLHRVAQDVLPVARAVVEPSHELLELGVHAVRAHLEAGHLAHFDDLPVDLVANLGHHLFDARGVDAAVCDQPLERNARDLASHRVERRQDHRLRRVVDDHVDAGDDLERADVAALAPDDAALHVVARQVHDRDARFARMIAGVALDRQRAHLAGLALGVALRRVTDLRRAARRLGPRLVLDGGHQLLARLLGRQPGDPRQLRGLLLHEPIELALARARGGLAYGEVVFELLQVALLLVDQLDAPVERGLLLLERALRLELGVAVLEHLALQLLLHGERLLAARQHGVALGRVSVAPRLGEYLHRELLGATLTSAPELGAHEPAQRDRGSDATDGDGDPPSELHRRIPPGSRATGPKQGRRAPLTSCGPAGAAGRSRAELGRRSVRGRACARGMTTSPGESPRPAPRRGASPAGRPVRSRRSRRVPCSRAL